MFKKQKSFIVIVFILIQVLSLTIVGHAAEDYIDKTNIENGVINVNYKSTKTIAVRVSKGKINYDYILSGSEITVPLQLGNGEYTISILENIEGKRYKLVYSESITLNLTDLNKVYLQSIHMINFNEDMEVVKLAKKLTENASTDIEKVKIIYNYVVENISYDFTKAKKISSNYVPNVDETLSSANGLCYDYASLTAAMLRSLDIPTKLVMGYKNDIQEYHAWNQVYLSETKEWVNIDTTYGAGLKSQKTPPDMIRESTEYKIEKQY